MRAVVTGLIAAASLIGGFGVVELTGLRWLGGVVLVLGAAWCVLRHRQQAWWRLMGVVLVGAIGFTASHLLSDTLGAWPSVLLVSAVVGVAGWWLLSDRSGTAPRPSTS